MKQGLVTFAIVGLGCLALTGNASADAEQGEKLFRKCQACHSLEPGENKVGPSLHGIMEQPAGHVEGYTYSNAMKETGLVWDNETMTEWLRSPKKLLKGTKMAFPGLQKDQDVKDIIEFLRHASQ